MEIPSPVLIIGDTYVSKNNIMALKNKYESFYQIVEISATEKSLDYIFAVCGTGNFMSQPKLVIISDLPNQKAVRQGLIDLVSVPLERTKYIIWDSNDSIKLDPKTKLPNKTWSEFIEKFKQIKDSKFINNGAGFNERDDGETVAFVESCFAKHKREIDSEASKLFVSIVGKERGLIISEVDKLCATAPKKLSTEYILENAFPTASDAVLFKFGNALDGTYSQAIMALEQFLDLGVNSNVLAEVMAKKVRWQLAACDLYSKGMAWYDVDKHIVNMGKFPSLVWNNDRFSYDQKQKFSEKCESEEGLKEFIEKGWGLPLDYFNIGEIKPKKSKKAKKGDDDEDEPKTAKKSVLGKKEVLPMPFLATQMTSAIQSNLIKPNSAKFDSQTLKAKVLDRAIKVYLGVVERLKTIRYGDDPTQALYEMVRMITDRTLEVSEE